MTMQSKIHCHCVKLNKRKSNKSKDSE